MLEYVGVNVLVLVLGLTGASLLNFVIFSKILTSNWYKKAIKDIMLTSSEAVEEFGKDLDKHDDASTEQKGENDEDEDDYVLPF